MPQLAFDMPTPKKAKRGWRRGRRRTTGRRNTPHVLRPELTPRIPVHVTMRLDRATGNARRRELYKAIRTATTRVNPCIRIVHLSIQRSHLHAIVEANDRDALSRGMQGFSISAARHINRACGRKRGRVFADRYNAQYLKSPSQTRNAIAYVLNNWRHHRDDAISPTFRIDPYSSAILFDGFVDYTAPPRPTWATAYEPLDVRPPESWVLRVGWRRAGAISCREIPSE